MFVEIGFLIPSIQKLTVVPAASSVDSKTFVMFMRFPFGNSQVIVESRLEICKQL